ncbi:uncharacterized protein LOC120161307 [Hibiscus syriacus]|uniref:uncharacterized protein LOC120161307 n=1 Tax=Hibiscus syriacus TaxID=106335 RepID=UPI00192393E4|nr:uncharacterized protein LOC120161307 [Hibiscus syriacus]
MGPKYASEETEQQHSPMSVLDFEYGEEKAWQLVNRVKEIIPSTSHESNICVDKLLLDLIREEIETKWYQNEELEYFETVRKLIKAWIDGANSESETIKREGCVREWKEREGGGIAIFRKKKKSWQRELRDG